MFTVQSVYLLADISEAAVWPVVLVRLPKDRVEGLVAAPPGGPGVAGDGERCQVHLDTQPGVSASLATPTYRGERLG